MIPELNDRAQVILRHIVDQYLLTGEATGSRSLSKLSELGLSPATIRNVMADLEDSGLLFARHISAGRLPTQAGLRLYVDGLMQVGTLDSSDRTRIEEECAATGHSVSDILDRASTLLSSLSNAAGLVVAPKLDRPLKHIQFMQLEPTRLLVILIGQDNLVENRILETQEAFPPAALIAAAAYLNDRVAGRTLGSARAAIMAEMEAHRTQLDAISADLVRRGIALDPSTGGPGAPGQGHIVIRGQSSLLQDVRAVEDLERARNLFAMLEEQENFIRLLESAQDANGVQIFIGAENNLFDHAGWSMVIAPYRAGGAQIVGAIGVIGPTRINYGRIIPLVDYTSRVVGRLLGG